MARSKPKTPFERFRSRTDSRIVSIAIVGIATAIGAMLVVVFNATPSVSPVQQTHAKAASKPAAATPAESTKETPASHTPSSKAGLAATNEVVIADLAFSPAHITIRRGTAVTWTNNDDTQHAIVTPTNLVASQPGPNSPPLNQGDSYTFTFNTVGTFPYSCVFHPEMEGSVVVTP